MAIKGIGVDLCDIPRMQKALGRKGLAVRVFCAEEIAYAENMALPARHYAGTFAAKEALAKAGGWGIGAMGLKSCHVERTRTGPRFVFTQEFRARMEQEGILHAHLSISHDGNFAVAMVVLESQNDSIKDVP